MKQRRALDRLLIEQCRLYNAALEERRGAWRLERRSVTRFDQYKQLTGLADQEPALMAYGVTVARGTLVRLDRAFQAFFRRSKAGEAPGFPRFRSARRFDSVEWPDTSGWKLHEPSRRLYLQGVGHVALRLHRSWRGTPKTITVARIGRRWQVTVFCTDVPARPLPATGALDRARPGGHRLRRALGRPAHREPPAFRHLPGPPGPGPAPGGRPHPRVGAPTTRGRAGGGDPPHHPQPAPGLPPPAVAVPRRRSRRDRDRGPGRRQHDQAAQAPGR